MVGRVPPHRKGICVDWEGKREKRARSKAHLRGAMLTKGSMSGVKRGRFGRNISLHNVTEGGLCHQLRDS